MASLAGTQIKNTYTGLLKTTANDAITGSLKRITDGAGANSALQLSSSQVKADSLLIENVSETNTLTRFLTWNDTAKTVGYYNFTQSDPAVSFATTSTDVTVTVGDNVNNTFSIADGANTTVNLTGTTITIDAELTRAYFGEGLGPTTPGTNFTDVLTSDESGKTFTLANIGQEVTQIILPTAEPGLRYKFVVLSDNKGTFQIDCADGDAFRGAILLNNSATDRSAITAISIPYSIPDFASSNDDRISLRASTPNSGNKPGTWVEAISFESGRWVVTGCAYCDEDYTYFTTGSEEVPGAPSASNLPEIFQNAS